MFTPFVALYGTEEDAETETIDVEKWVVGGFEIQSCSHA